MIEATHTRTCVECSAVFTVARTPGRPPSRCSNECQRIAARRARSTYLDRVVNRRAVELLAQAAAA